MLKPTDELRAYLERSAQTQVELAQKLGISQAALSMVLSGKRLPSLSLAIAIERVTGVSCRGWVEAAGPTDRRALIDRRQGGRRRSNRLHEPDRRKEPRR